MMNYGGMGMVGPSMVSRDLLVRHLHGLCCVAFHDNELICGLCCGGKDFILCWNCGTISPFEGECVRISILWFLLFLSFLFILLLPVILLLFSVFVMWQLFEQAYDTQCLSQSPVLCLSRPVLFPVCPRVMSCFCPVLYFSLFVFNCVSCELAIYT